LTKIKLYSFIQIDKILKYNHIFNIAKNVNDKSANKLITYTLIAYNGKMLTTNSMLKLKWSEYSCLQIYNIDAQIIGIKWTPQQYEISNRVAQDDRQHNAALRQRNQEEEKTQKNLISVKITYLYFKKKNCDHIFSKG
jgi:hypothetical protein